MSLQNMIDGEKSSLSGGIDESGSMWPLSNLKIRGTRALIYDEGQDSIRLGKNALFHKTLRNVQISALEESQSREARFSLTGAICIRHRCFVPSVTTPRLLGQLFRSLNPAVRHSLS